MKTGWMAAALLAGALLAGRADAGERADADRARIQKHFAGKTEHWTWIFYGDSITQGAKHTHGWRAFCEIFGERVRFEMGRPLDAVINSGNSGYDTKGMLSEAHYKHQVRRFSPNVVLIMLGMNDPVRGIDVDQFGGNLAALVDRIRADGAIPVLQTSNTIQSAAHSPAPYPPEYAVRYEKLPAYMERVREVAARKDVILVDHFAYWGEAAADPAVLAAWLGETIHPGAKGHQEMAILILKTLDLYGPDSACCRLAAGGAPAATDG